MSTIFIMIVSSAVSAIGWWIGSFFGIIWAFIISSVGAFYGLYLGWKINRDYFE